LLFREAYMARSGRARSELPRESVFMDPAQPNAPNNWSDPTQPIPNPTRGSAKWVSTSI